MEKSGDIFKKKYGGWYSVRDETYYKESETEVREGARYATPTGTPVEWNEEETYFFRLSAYQERLLDLYEKNPAFILPTERRNEVVSFVKSGLEDLSISRSTLDWGIPVPDAPGHVMYVWVDALTNYVTATGLLNKPTGSRADYWPADVHVIGKDIVRFHAVYWPAFLMSAGLALPKRIYSHGFVLNRGEKMSKSVGNVVDPFDLVRTYGVDQVRYFFLREVMFGQDGNYSTDAIANRINADLANDLGNLAQRSLSMIAKNCDEKVPEPGDFTDADKTILAAADALYAKAREAMDRQAVTKYLDAVWAVVADANRYFAAEEPWAKKKTDPKRMETILYVTAEVVRQIAILAAPVMPASAAKLLDLLSQDAAARSFAALGENGSPCARHACSGSPRRVSALCGPRGSGQDPACPGAQAQEGPKVVGERAAPHLSLSPWGEAKLAHTVNADAHRSPLPPGFSRLRRRPRRRDRACPRGRRRPHGDHLDPHP